MTFPITPNRRRATRLVSERSSPLLPGGPAGSRTCSGCAGRPRWSWERRSLRNREGCGAIALAVGNGNDLHHLRHAYIHLSTTPVCRTSEYVTTIPCSYAWYTDCNGFAPTRSTMKQLFLFVLFLATVASCGGSNNSHSDGGTAITGNAGGRSLSLADAVFNKAVAKGLEFNGGVNHASVPDIRECVRATDRRECRRKFWPPVRRIG